jgi:hypothetical protein
MKQLHNTLEVAKNEDSLGMVVTLKHARIYAKQLNIYFIFLHYLTHHGFF